MKSLEQIQEENRKAIIMAANPEAKHYDLENTSGKEGIHNMPLKQWEAKYSNQEELIEFTNEALKKL